MSVSVGPYSEGDRRPFIDLYRDVFESDLDHFNWKYEQFPGVDQPQIVVAKNKDDIVGAVGALYIPLRYKEQPITGRRPVDIMVKEEYRSHRLFLDLVNELRELRNDIAVEFGTGVRETRIAWERFGGWGYENIDRYARIQHPSDLLSETTPVSLSILCIIAGVPLQIINKFRDMISAIGVRSWNVSKEPGYIEASFDIPRRWSPYPVSIQRDTDYWSWRVSDPRINAYTYSVSKSDDPIASVLVAIKEDGERKDIIISLQDHVNDENGFSALINIYHNILKEHDDATMLRLTNNKVNKIIDKTNLDHNVWMKKLADSGIVKKMDEHVDLASDIDEIDKKPLGCRWFDDTLKEPGIGTSNWEYSDLISD